MYFNESINLTRTITISSGYRARICSGHLQLHLEVTDRRRYNSEVLSILVPSCTLHTTSLELATTFHLLRCDLRCSLVLNCLDLKLTAAVCLSLGLWQPSLLTSTMERDFSVIRIELDCLLRHLPSQLPLPTSLNASKYACFSNFSLDKDEVTDYGEVGALNEQFKRVFGWKTRTTGGRHSLD